MPAIDRITNHVARTGNRIFRPRDLPYKDATLVLRLLVQRRAIYRLAHGYYLLPPDTHRGVQTWRPSVEGTALGIALADYPKDTVALTGVSAARIRGVPPRAVATGVVAIPKSHRPKLNSEFGEILFVSRETPGLDLERAHTEVVDGWATTPEQTLLDMAKRPTLGGISAAMASEVITELARGADWNLVERLAALQRARSAFARASWLAAAVRAVDPVRGKSVPSLSLKPVTQVDPKQFGIVR